MINFKGPESMSGTQWPVAESDRENFDLLWTPDGPEGTGLVCSTLTRDRFVSEVGELFTRHDPEQNDMFSISAEFRTDTKLRGSLVVTSNPPRIQFGTELIVQSGLFRAGALERLHIVELDTEAATIVQTREGNKLNRHGRIKETIAMSYPADEKTIQDHLDVLAGSVKKQARAGVPFVRWYSIAIPKGDIR